MDFLRAGRGGIVPVAQTGTKYGEAVSLLGLPLGTGVVCSGGARAYGQSLVGAAGTIDHRAVADTCRTSPLSILERAKSDAAIFGTWHEGVLATVKRSPTKYRIWIYLFVSAGFVVAA